MLTQRDELIPRFVEAGLDGLEAFYPNCRWNRDFYWGWPKKHKMLVTGGSDAHGAGKTKHVHWKVVRSLSVFRAAQAAAEKGRRFEKYP